MTFNRRWIIKDKSTAGLLDCAAETACPYFKRTSCLASYSLGGQCMAGGGNGGRFSTSRDIRDYCLKDYTECPVYQAALAGVSDYQNDDAFAWPVL